MRICYVADGRSIHVRRWTEWFATRGHSVHLITPASPPLDHASVVVQPIDRGFFLPRPWVLLSIRAAIERMNPDLVHAHFVLGYGMYAALAGFHPLVVSAWGSDIALAPRTSLVARQTCRFVLRRADLIHIGDPDSKRTVAALGGPISRCLVQPWGVDIRAFSPEGQSEELRESLCGPQDVLFFANRSLEPIFRHDVLIEAARELATRRGEFAIAIAGDGSARRAVEALVDRSGLRDRVKFLGKIPPSEMPKYYASSDVYVDCFGSQTPGHGASLSLVEAMACGLPVLVAQRPGLDAFVEDGVSGWTFPADRYEDLARLMEAIILERERLKRPGVEALRRARAVGDRDRTLAAFERRMVQLSEEWQG